MAEKTPREAFEEALVENPDDVATSMAYADWLQEQGDSRGEFIQVQLALENEELPGEDRKRLEQREKELLQLHGSTWLGELSGFRVASSSVAPEDYQSHVRFARGWIDEMVLRDDNDREKLEKVGRSPELRLLRSLTLPYVQSAAAYAPEDGYADPLVTLATSAHLGNLRVVRLGTDQSFREEEEPYDAGYNARWELYSVPAEGWDFLERLERLEELYLHCLVPDIESLLGSATISNLKILQIYFSTDYPLAALASNPAAQNLTHLSLHPAAVHANEGEEAFLGLSHLRAITGSKNLTSLRHLRFRKSTAGDEGCAELVRSGLLGRLKVLDLSGGLITDAGVEMLLSSPDLKGLEMLDLSGNALRRRGLDLLKRARIPHRAENQHGPEDEEFLYEGEWE